MPEGWVLPVEHAPHAWPYHQPPHCTNTRNAIIVRATVPNPDNMLINNGLVDVNIVANEDTSKLALPLQALLLDQQGAYVLVVDEDNIVKAARIEVGEQRGGYLVVQSGLDAGAKVIVEGIQKARPGSKVAPSILNEAN